MVVQADGDYLLTGGPARKEAYLQILDKSLSKPPVVHGIRYEGMVEPLDCLSEPVCWGGGRGI